MMRLLSWNVQWCRGVDGVVDPSRIAAYIRAQSADVACLQEVAVNIPELQAIDQVDSLASSLSGYEAFYAAGVDLPGRNQFGNLILSRLPVGRVMRHSLPWPASPDTPSMPRVAVEAVIAGIRVLTTHLEYHARAHRDAQINRLLELHAEALASRREVSEVTYRDAARPASAVMCGDFNLPPTDGQHGDMLKAGFVDAWQALHPGKPHPPSFRIYERKEGVDPYCCDFVFVTPDLVPRLKAIRIDGENQASDHQPVIVDFR
jgi:endonuclease/exonuclease/phosphatase family metal-dependent hydrolase